MNPDSTLAVTNTCPKDGVHLSMYDPLVVDTFINVFAKIAPAAIKAGQEARSLVTAGTFEDLTSDPGESLRQIRASASETAVLGACDHAILASNSAAEALSAAGQSLRELTPATVLALYTYDTGKDALVCTSTLGDTLKLLDQLTISLGERVTGWCGANLRACKEITACTVDRRVVRCARGVGHPAGKACSAGARAHRAIAPGVGGD